MQGIFQKENTDKALKYGIYRHLPTYEKIIRNLVSFLYKDRLLRFGFELIEYIASLYNCEIEIIDNTEKSEQQELVEDLVQIITVFSCKLQGKRANKAKKLIRELIQEETDGKSHKSNVDTKQRTEN